MPVKKSIICVDDEYIVLTSLREQLKKEFLGDCSIELVDSGEKCLELINDLVSENVEIPVIICDQIMPGMKGDELLIKIHSILPKTNKILLTGQASAEDIGNIVNNANLYRYIQKPWEINDFNLTVREAVKSFEQMIQIEEKNKKVQEMNEALKEMNLGLEMKVEERTQELKEKLEILKKAQEKLIVTEKVASIGRMSAGIAHEINSPLGAILTTAQMMAIDINNMESGEIKNELLENISVIEDASRKSKEIIGKLLRYSEKDEKNNGEVEIKEAIRAAIALIRERINDIEINLKIEKETTIKGNFSEIVNAFYNVIENSVDALSGKKITSKEIKIACFFESEDSIAMIFEDNGAGIDESIKLKIFDPFFSTKEIGKGVGLGLTLTYDILKKHNADIEVISKKGEFTRVIIRFKKN